MLGVGPVVPWALVGHTWDECLRARAQTAMGSCSGVNPRTGSVTARTAGRAEQIVQHFHRLDFPTHEEARRAADALLMYVVCNSHVCRTHLGPHRVVLWEQRGPVCGRRSLFLSPAAVTILARLILELPPARTVRLIDLPDDRVLLIGNGSDWGAIPDEDA